MKDEAFAGVMVGMTDVLNFYRGDVAGAVVHSAPARPTRFQRLLERAWAIRDEHAHGFWVPAMQHLAWRGDEEAMIAVADWYAQPFATELGYLADPFGAFQMYRRAYRNGSAHAAYNLAMSFFARRDLPRYREWLRRAARAGDRDAALPFRRFELRRPHANARRIGRLRRLAKRDEFG